MTAPALMIRIELEGFPELRFLAETWEAEHALRAWLELGFAGRNIAEALERLNDEWRRAA